MSPRWFHHVYAVLLGYFWLPCPNCGQMFGGHEPHGGILVTSRTDGSRGGWILCERCPDDIEP